MKKQILVWMVAAVCALFLFNLAPAFPKNSAPGKEKTQALAKSAVNKEFSSFWKKFQGAVARGDKEAVADMSKFPLKGDDMIFNTEDGKTIYSNDKMGFVAYAYDEAFSKSSINYIKKIKQVKNGSLGNYLNYSFTPLSELAAEGYLPDFLDKGADGYLLRLDYEKGEDEYNIFYYFVKYGGEYKFIGVQFAG